MSRNHAYLNNELDIGIYPPPRSSNPKLVQTQIFFQTTFAWSDNNPLHLHNSNIIYHTHIRTCSKPDSRTCLPLEVDIILSVLGVSFISTSKLRLNSDE